MTAVRINDKQMYEDLKKLAEKRQRSVTKQLAIIVKRALSDA